MISKTIKFKKAIILINSIFLIIIILFTPLAYYIFNLNYYKAQYENNGVFLSLNKYDVLNITEKIFKFFKYKTDLDPLDYTSQVRYAEETISGVAFFGPDEISHLDDVRILLSKIFALYYGSIILFIVLTFFLIEKNVKRFLRSLGIMFTASSIVVFITFIVFYFLSRNFSFLFEKFHLVFFPQGNYTFAESSLIITLFPFGFFYDFFIRLIVCSSLLSIVLLVLGIIGINLPKIREISNNQL